ncbi:MAG: HAMP domain-containing protein, partial [Methanococcaceae archaeon]
MKISLSNRIGIILASVLFVTLGTMSFLILSHEESELRIKTRENILGLSNGLKESIVFAMGEGITDAQPLIEKLKGLENITELNIKTSQAIRKSDNIKYDDYEMKVLTLGKRIFTENDAKDQPILRSIEPIIAKSSCIQCHSGIKEGETMAVINLFYSFKDTEKFILSQRTMAIIIAIFTIIVSYLIIMYFIKKRILRYLIKSIKKIKLISNGIRELTNGIDHLSKGELNNSVAFTTDKLQFKLNNEMDELVEDINSMIDNFELAAVSFTNTEMEISKLINETNKLTGSARKGNLDDRVDARQFEGAFRELITGINNTLQEISIPIKNGA